MVAMVFLKIPCLPAGRPTGSSRSVLLRHRKRKSLLYSGNRLRDGVDKTAERAAEEKDDDKHDTHSEERIALHARAPIAVAMRERAGQERFEHFRTVERRDGNEIEDAKHDVHDHDEEEDVSDRRREAEPYQKPCDDGYHEIRCGPR